MGLGNQIALQTRKHNSFLAWTSSLTWFTGSCVLWTEVWTGKVGPRLPCCSQPCQWKQSRSNNGYRCHKIVGSQKKCWKKPPLFCNLITVVMTLVKSGRLETGWLISYIINISFLRIGQRCIFQTATLLTKQLFTAGNILLPLTSPG